MRLMIVLLKPRRDDDMLYGAEHTALDIATALSQLGERVSILQWHPQALPVNMREVRLLRVPSSPPGGFLRLGVAVARAAKQTDSRTIYAYADYFYETFVPAYLGSLLARKKLMVAVLDDFERQTDEKSLPEVFAWWHRRGHSLRSSARITSLRLALRTTAVSAVSSGSVAAYARDVLKARRVVVVRRGIDRTWFGRTSSLRSYDAIYVGGLWNYKRVDVLISAWREVAEARPGARLLIVGEGVERSSLEKLTRETGLSKVVEFRGHLNDANEIHELLSESRIFVFPSTHEGWSRAVVEAMATGLPCVLSDIPAFRELYSRTAILVPPGDPGFLARKILMLLEDKTMYEELAHRGTELASGFTWDAVAARILAA
jgi:glycosyltransferase involved in cell wall biosynthesis